MVDTCMVVCLFILNTLSDLIHRFIFLLLFFFFIEFHYVSAFDDCAHHHQIKASINFWYKWELNPKSLTQPLKSLP